mgnify:CR=1 FL=1
MPSFTVQQLKTAIANIPTGANAWLVEVPDDLVLPVADSRTFGPHGELMLHIRGYINVATRNWTPVS